jgi:DNA repair exonuclease SbcCD ATPase subunit
MKSTVKEIVDFYKAYPHLKGKIKAKTPYGFKKIEEASQTDYSAPLEISTNNRSLICSKKHRFKVNDDTILNDSSFIEANSLKIGDDVLTELGKEKISKISFFNKKEKLYDFQIEDVKQYFTNGFVSHNSSIFADSLMFGLFGKPLRKISLPDIPNTINNKKSCEVKLWFSLEDNHFMIYRGIAPGFLKLYENYSEGDENKKNNEDEKQDSSKKYTQKRIDELIGSNFNTLSHLLIMSNTYTSPFLDLDSKKKREIIEDILGVGIFGDMANSSKTKSLDLKSDLKVLEKEYELNLSNISTMEENVGKLKEKAEEFETVKKKKLDNIQTKLSDLENEETTLIEKINKETTLNEQVAEFSNHLAQTTEDLETNKEKLLLAKQTKKNNVDKLKSLKDSPVCPLCNTLTSSEHIEEHLTKLKDETKEALDIINNSTEQITKINRKEELLNKKITKLKSEIQESKLSIKLLEQVDEKKKDLNSEIQEIKKEKNNFIELINEDEIKEKKDQLEKLQSELNEQGKLRKHYEYIRKLLSDNGIKNYIIKKIIKFWNMKVNFYLKELNAEFSIEFDDSLDALIKSRKRDPLQYHSFSGGEKARIDVAILLSVIDISKLQNSIDINVMVIDELLDGGLDDNGREDVINLFKLMCQKQNKSIYVISHNVNLPLDLFNSEILLEKKNGFTSIV